MRDGQSVSEQVSTALWHYGSMQAIHPILFVLTKFRIFCSSSVSRRISDVNV
jgi:hypothetical protein